MVEKIIQALLMRYALVINHCFPVRSPATIKTARTAAIKPRTYSKLAQWHTQWESLTDDIVYNSHPIVAKWLPIVVSARGSSTADNTRAPPVRGLSRFPHQLPTKYFGGSCWENLYKLFIFICGRLFGKIKLNFCNS